MLTITDAALARLRALSAEVCGPDEALRLVLSAGGAVDFDVVVPRMADQVIESEGRPVLLVDNSTAGILDDATLDVAAGAGEPTFVLKRPG